MNRLAQDVRVEIDEHNRQWSIAKHELTEIEEELEAAKRKQNTEEEHIVKYDEYIENAWADAQEVCCVIQSINKLYLKDFLPVSI